LLNSNDAGGGLNITPPKEGEAGYLGLHFANTLYTPDDVTFTVTSPRRCLLVSSEANGDGWVAEVNGKRVPIYTANYHFRSIPLPSGQSKVAFRYRPAPVTNGAKAALASSGLIFMVLLISAAARRGKSKDNTSST
jgi:uncharacterized membrane protein YfhO